ncbi:MAG: hypothetical protein RIA08_10605 [Roseovarius sp.]
MEHVEIGDNARAKAQVVRLCLDPAIAPGATYLEQRLAQARPCLFAVAVLPQQGGKALSGHGSPPRHGEKSGQHPGLAGAQRHPFTVSSHREPAKTIEPESHF